MTTTPDQPPARSQHQADLSPEEQAAAARQDEQTQFGTTDEQPTVTGDQPGE